MHASLTNRYALQDPVYHTIHVLAAPTCAQGRLKPLQHKKVCNPLLSSLLLSTHPHRNSLHHERSWWKHHPNLRACAHTICLPLRESNRKFERESESVGEWEGERESERKGKGAREE